MFLASRFGLLERRFICYYFRMRKIIIALIITVAACSSGPTPKQTVFEFIDAVKSSDSLKIVQILDINAYVESRMPEMSPEDSARVLDEYRVKTIQSLLDNGEVRSRFLHDLIVVNTEFRRENVAEVEVSFVNKETRAQLYTKMQLHRQPDGAWRITYFK
jgi:hypothetical protein